jgi:hypothetical protein
LRSVAALKADHERQVEDVYAEIGRLTTQLSWLKKVGTMNCAERLACIERNKAKLPLSVQAELLGISRRSLYYQPKDPPLSKTTCSTGISRRCSWACHINQSQKPCRNKMRTQANWTNPRKFTLCRS